MSTRIVPMTAVPCTAVVLCLYVTSAHAFFLGDNVTAQMEPNGSFWNATPSNATVIDPGVEFILTLTGNDAFSVDITADTVELTLVRTLSLGLGANEELTLSGLSLPGGSTPFVVTNDDNVPGIEASDISLSGNTLTWDLHNTGGWLNGQQVILTFVPEPSTFSACVLAAMSCLLARRTRLS